MHFSKWTVVMLGALCAVPLLATQAAAPVSSNQETKVADQWLQDMKAEAQTIAMHAAQLERLAKDSSTPWTQFDEQWNEIKPAQESLQRNMWRLEGMSSSLSDQQRKALDESKQAARQLSARTRELFKMID